MIQNSIFHRQRLVSEALANLSEPPSISIIMPVYNPPMPYFQMAVDSVFAQCYTNWELCIANDASPDPVVRPMLNELAAKHPQVKIFHRPQNGHISEATNSAVKLASGEFIAFVDQDDEITPDCLALLALYIAEHPETDVVYTDDDKINADGNCYAEQYKQDYDPFQLLSFMTLGHTFCVRRTLYLELEGFRKGFEGSQDYDFALRVVEKARHVGHIPVITYHWRSIPGSTAASGNEKSYSFDAGLRGVQDALNRRGIQGTAIHPDWARACGCGLFSVDFPHAGEKVSVLLPITQEAPYSYDCLRLLDKTSYENVHFVLIAPQGCEVPLPSEKFSVLYADEGITDAASLCDLGAQSIQTPWMLFLAPDLAPHYPYWLTRMMGWAQIHGVGCVGGKIYSQDARILHAGYFHSFERLGIPSSMYVGEEDQWGNHFRLVTPLCCDAVSSSCMLIRTDLYTRFQGFDRKHFSKTLYDVDLCYRLANHGLQSLFCPDARFSCQTKGRTYQAYGKKDIAYFRQQYLERKRKVNPYFARENSMGCMHEYSHPVPLARPPKTLMVTHGLGPEGAPRFSLMLSKGLEKKNTGSIAVWSHGDGPLKADFTSYGIPVSILQREKDRPLEFSSELSDLDIYVAQNLSFLDMSSAKAFEVSLTQIGQRMITQQFDVVFANTILAFWAVLAATHVGIPTIWTIHESEPPFLHFEALPQFVQDAAARCFTHAYRVIFVAHATKELFQQNFVGENFVVIHNALQNSKPIQNSGVRQKIRHTLKVKKQEQLVLMLGTVFPRKGQEDFVQALEHLPQEILEQARFSIVGDREKTEYSHKIHSLINKLPPHVRKRMTILPETTSPDSYYQAADIFVCCSRIESFPLVILEAMKYSLPIVTTPVFGISEQVVDQESALFYEPGDTHTLATNISKFILNHNLRKQMGEEARNALDRLPTYSELIDKYYQIIKEAAFSLGA